MKLCNKDACTGCMACINICAVGALKFQYDTKGFGYPEIDAERCVKCESCSRVCPASHSTAPIDHTPVVYAAKSKNAGIRAQSSSGGIFSELALQILNRGGVVFGAAFDEKLHLRHMAVHRPEELTLLRGSKYLQSEIGNSFQNVRRELLTGKSVLFCGTPCQVAGLKSFLGKPYPELFTVDLVCHGVPSPKVFRNYCEMLQRKLGIKITDYFFRDKKWSWKHFNSKIVGVLNENASPEAFSRLIYADNAWYGTWESDPWTRGFLSNYFLRPSCYSCRYSNMNRPGDITLADYWGYHSRRSLLDDDRGISMVLLNNKHGRELFELLKNRVIYVPTSCEEAIGGNKALSGSFQESPLSADFWATFEQDGYEGTLERFMGPEKLGLELRTLYKFGRNSIRFRLVRLFILLAWRPLRLYRKSIQCVRDFGCRRA